MFLNSTADLSYSQPVHVNNSYMREIRDPLKSLGLLTVLPEPILYCAARKKAPGAEQAGASSQRWYFKFLPNVWKLH